MMNRMGRDATGRLMNAREAAAYLRISLSTLQLIERQGFLAPYRTPGGHRRYSHEMVNAYLESTRSAHEHPQQWSPPEEFVS